MSRILLRGVSFAFGDDVTIFDSLELAIGRGWHGLVGANGSGKTTLLRLIGGELAPRGGRIDIDPRDAVVATADQRVDVRSDDIGALAAADERASVRLRVALALDPSELERWPSLSPGERRRWQIGGALARRPDVLLLDEPTNHLDARGREVLIEALLGFRGVGIVVSHDRALLDGLTTRTIRIDRGRARAFEGAYSAAREAWLREAQAIADARTAKKDALRKAERALDEARRERASADTRRSAKSRMRSAHDSDGRSAGATTRAMWAEARAGRAVAVRRAITERARDALDHAEVATDDLGRTISLGFARSPSPCVLSIDRDELRAGDRVVLRDVRLALGRDDRIRLAGPNGAGKTTLIRALCAGASRRVLYVPQDPPASEIAASLDAIRALPPDARGRTMSLIAALGADPSRVLASPAPSPGEARKVALALGLALGAHALVLDEPTNHLDLPSIERLERALAAYPGALLIVTHDDRLAGALTTRTWSVVEGRVR